MRRGGGEYAPHSATTLNLLGELVIGGAPHSIALSSLLLIASSEVASPTSVGHDVTRDSLIVGGNVACTKHTSNIQLPLIDDYVATATPSFEWPRMLVSCLLIRVSSTAIRSKVSTAFGDDALRFEVYPMSE